MEKVHRLRAALVIDVHILQRPQAQVVRRLMSRDHAMQSKNFWKPSQQPGRDADQQGRGLVRIVPSLRLLHRRGPALSLLERDEPPAQQLHPLVPFVGERRLFQPLRRHLHALVVPAPLRENKRKP